ncbi:MAG: bifunctional folylpolyglutamate synthase/dihydrofolate synthase [Gemmatimonadota bacterium]
MTRTQDRRNAFDSLLRRSPSTRIEWGLERIACLLDAVDSPQNAYRSILVGGTNGKGSVAAICEAVLRAHGTRTGLYTSPHLIDAAERVKVGGVPLEEDLLERCAREVLPSAERADATFFESLTAVAFLAFAEAGVEVAVVEVGLGGRFDATNVLRPDACVITGVAMDHSDWLGDSLGQIAAEKSGIIKSRTPLVTGRLVPEVEIVIAARATELEAPRVAFDRDFDVGDVSTGRGGTRFTYRIVRSGPQSDRCPRELDGESFALPLPGEHQALNASLALSAVSAAGLAVRAESTRTALKGVHWPGRLQVLAVGDATVVLDVAHNPAGVESLTRALEQIALPAPIVGLVGILGDKPWPEMLEPLMRTVGMAVFTVPESAPVSRAWDPEEARNAIGEQAVEVVPGFAEALERALELAGSGTVLVTGSNHTVGDALRRLQKQN